MAQFPALTLWTDAYLSDTRHLSTLEHGAYLLLLMEAWRRPNCDLPDEDRFLARLAGVSAKEWADIKPVIMEFWTRDGRSKTWKQKRLSKERDAAKKRSKSQKDNSAKRWNKTEKADATGYAKKSHGNPSTATATVEEEAKASPSSAHTARPKKKRDEPFVLPDWVPVEPWDGFVAMRVKIGHPMTDHGKRLAVGELARLAEDGHPPGAVLNQSIFRSYRGLFEIKDQDNGNRQRNGPASTVDAVQRAFELTGDAAPSASARPPGSDRRIGAVSDPVRSIGHVER